MTQKARAERAAKLLAARLEALAAAAERASGRGESLLLHRIELAHGATQHAISLNLLTQEEAAEIWAAAERRHPALAQLDALSKS